MILIREKSGGNIEKRFSGFWGKRVELEQVKAVKNDTDKNDKTLGEKKKADAFFVFWDAFILYLCTGKRKCTAFSEFLVGHLSS